MNPPDLQAREDGGVPRPELQPIGERRRRWTSAYSVSAALHLSLLLAVPARCIEREASSPAPTISVALIGPSVEELELASLAPSRERPEPDEAPDTDEPSADSLESQEAPDASEPPPPPPVVEDDPLRQRFVRVDEEGGVAPEDPSYIAAHDASPLREARARPDSLEVGPTRPPSPPSEGATPKPGQGEATWDPIAVRMPEVAPGGAPAPEDEARSEESSGVEGGEEAAELTPTEAEPRETPEDAARPTPGDSRQDQTGGPTLADPSPAPGDAPGDAGPASERAREETRPSDRSDVGDPDGAEAAPVAEADPAESDGVEADGPLADADLDSVPDGPDAIFEAGGGEAGARANAGAPDAGARTPAVTGEAGDGLERPSALAPGEQLSGDPTAAPELNLRAADAEAEARQEQRRPRDGETLDASVLTSGPALVDTQHSPDESAGAPGALSLMGAPTTSPVAVGDEALPLDAATAVGAVATDLGRYFHQVESILREGWKVPRELVFMGAQGTTSVRVAVAPSGQILLSDVQRKSGFEALDRAALTAFPRRLPRPPAAAPDPLYMVFDFVQRDDWISAGGRADE